MSASTACDPSQTPAPTSPFSARTASWPSLPVVLIAAAIACFAGTSQAQPLQGAGSTFAAPVIARWSQLYRAARTDGGDFSSPDCVGGRLTVRVPIKESVSAI
jgi:hypothetical protein